MEPAHCSRMLWQSLGEMCPGGTPKGSSWSGGHHFVAAAFGFPLHIPKINCFILLTYQGLHSAFCSIEKFLQHCANPLQQNEAVSLVTTILSRPQRSGTKWQLHLNCCRLARGYMASPPCATQVTAHFIRPCGEEAQALWVGGERGRRALQRSCGGS